MRSPAEPAPVSASPFWFSVRPPSVTLGSTFHAPNASRTPPRKAPPAPEPVTLLLIPAS